jgi:putative flippase GtrA
VVDHHPDVTDALDATGAAAAVAAGPVPSRPTASRLQQVLPRVMALRHELGKFGAVGVIAYAVDVTTYNLLLQKAHVQTLVAHPVATVLAATLAFIGNRFWTWRHRSRSGLHREYTMYFAVNLVGLAIGEACLATSHYGLGAVWPALQGVIADNVARNIVGMALGTIFRFWAYRRFVFRDSGPPLSDAAVTT